MISTGTNNNPLQFGWRIQDPGLRFAPFLPREQRTIVEVAECKGLIPQGRTQQEGGLRFSRPIDFRLVDCLLTLVPFYRRAMGYSEHGPVFLLVGNDSL